MKLKGVKQVEYLGYQHTVPEWTKYMVVDYIGCILCLSCKPVIDKKDRMWKRDWTNDEDSQLVECLWMGMTDSKPFYEWENSLREV